MMEDLKFFFKDCKWHLTAAVVMSSVFVAVIIHSDNNMKRQPRIVVPNTPENANCIRACMPEERIECDVANCQEIFLPGRRNCLLTCNDKHFQTSDN